MARTRVFLAVDVGDIIRTAAVTLQQTLAKSGAGVNWVPRENMHVTLLFLGEVDDRDLVPVCRAVTKAVADESPFLLRTAGVGAFPTPRRPKVLWTGISDGMAELVRLHDLLETPLMDLGAYRQEERSYTPHLTLGRVKSEADGNMLAAELPKHLAWSGGYTTVSEVLVMGSELRRDGPEYTVIARAPLEG